MFRRKKPEGEDGVPDPALAPENLVAPATKVGPRPGFGPGASQPTLPNRIPTIPLRPAIPEVARPMTTELPRRPAEPTGAAGAGRRG